MRKLEIKDAEIMQAAVQQEILRSEEARYDHRLHGILLVCSGFSPGQVAKLFGHSPRTVQSWVHRFEKSGFAGLEDNPRPGRPPRLDEAVATRVGYSLPKTVTKSRRH
jgi:transposase